MSDPQDSQSFLDGGRGEFVYFEMKGERWVHLSADHTPEFVKQLDDERQVVLQEGWRACALLCGDVLRPGGTKSHDDRLMVIARTYTAETAAKRLSLSVAVIKEAVRVKDLVSFTDPEQRIRIPAGEVEAACWMQAAWNNWWGTRLCGSGIFRWYRGFPFRPFAAN